MEAPVPPGAPRPGYNSQVQTALRPPNNNFDFHNNPNSLADNMNTLNLSRPSPMPNYGHRPEPFGQPQPFSQFTPSPGLPVRSRPCPPSAALSRPVAPPSGSPPSTLRQNMPPLRPTGPPPIGQRPPCGSRPLPSGSLPSSMVGPSVPCTGSLPSIGSQSMGLSSGIVSEPVPSLGAQPSHPMSSLPLSGSSVVPPFSASGGSLDNGPPAFYGPQVPLAGSAPQPPVGPPTTMASARPPLQAPTMGSVLGSPALIVPKDPAMQTPSPASAGPRGIPPPPGSLYGLHTGPMRPQQVTPPHSFPGSAQSPGMFGMPTLPSQTMTTISPAMGQLGTQLPGQSKVDPRQIPRPDPSSSLIVYETRQGSQANPPPPATSDFIVMDKGNCSPRYMRCTIGQVPCTDDLLATSGMQLALLVQPLALSHPSEEPVQIVDCGESGPVRCSRCKAYVNPFMKFIDQGRRFVCNLCGFTDVTPRDYHCNLGPDGRRRDADERPELSRGIVEFIASKEYMDIIELDGFLVSPLSFDTDEHTDSLVWVRDPMPAVYFFLIDVSLNAIQTGATAAACSAISRVISELPEGPRTMVGVATFDSTIHFYNLKHALQQPLMLIVPDVEDVYTPLQTDVIVQLSECRQHLDLLLENIPTMFQYNRTGESAFGAAVKAAFLAMKSTGGKVLVFQSVLPSTGIGTLHSREAEGRTNILAGEKEAHKLLQPADKTLKTMAIELAEYQVCVDVFITTQSYVDIASISVIPRTTGGQVYYYYPFSALSDPGKLYNDLRWNITRPQGFEAVMRVRCSQGIKVQKYSGNFCKTVPTDVDLPGIDCDKSIMVTLKHDDKLEDGSECAFQCALLYTTVYGQRRIRVTNLSLPCTNMLSNMFRSADVDTQFACFFKQMANEIPSSPILHIREQVTKFCINILLSYRKFCATVSSSGQLILPESFKLLPLYTLALLKNTGLQTDGRIDDCSFWVNQIPSLSLTLTISLVLPRMVAIHDLNSKAGNGSLVPPKIPLTSENVNDDGIYLLENGEDCLIYVGNSADSDTLQQIFGVSLVDEIPTQFTLQQHDNPLSKKVNDVANEIRRQRCSYLRMKVCKKGDASGMLFFSHLIEDKHPSGPSYVEFLVQIHREIQAKMSL